MIITDDFIMLNIPKTASSFARKVIKEAYGVNNQSLFEKISQMIGFKKAPIKELILPNIKLSYLPRKDQHGTYDQIPKKYKNSNREIISVIRNPFSAYVSRYTFQSWKKSEAPNIETIKRDYFNHYPDLTFKEFLDLTIINQSYRLQGVPLKKGVKLGGLSLQFMQMFCRNHKEAIQHIDKDFRSNGVFEKYFVKTHFLKTESINQDIFEYLKNIGFKESELSFIKSAEKVRVSNNKPWQDYMTDETISQIKEYEWLLFELFPEYLDSI